MRRVATWLGALLGVCFVQSVEAQTIQVNVTEQHQTIDGFGGFGPAKVWWESAPHFDERYLDRIVDDLGTTILRTQLYWDFEPKNDDTDPAHLNLAGFNYGPNSDNGKQFAFIRAASARGVEKLIASVWTPPIWMKQNTDNSLAVFCRGQCGGTLNPRMREEFAEYLAAYIKVLKQETNVDLYALSLQNEPVFANAFESCVYTAEDYEATLNAVGARFRAEGITTKLFGPEHMGSFNWNDNSGLFAAALDSNAAQYLDAYAVHSYVDGVTPDFGNADGWTQIYRRVHAAGKPLWMTETSGDVSTYDKAFEMTRGLHLALKDGNVSAWVYWYYADSILDHGEPTALFYLFKNYYRFVRPNAVRVGASATHSDLLATAFTESDALTVIVINNGDRALSAALMVTGGGGHGAFTHYRTSATENFVALGIVAPQAIDFPARSVTTLVSGEPGGEPDPVVASVPLLAAPPRTPNGCGGESLSQAAAIALGIVTFFVIRSWSRRRKRQA